MQTFRYDQVQRYLMVAAMTLRIPIKRTIMTHLLIIANYAATKIGLRGVIDMNGPNEPGGDPIPDDPVPF